MQNLIIFREECCSKQSSPGSQNEEPIYSDEVDVEDSSTPLQSTFKVHKSVNETDFEW